MIQRGTLKKGDVLTAGTAFAKVKNMYDDQQHSLDRVTPSFPVEIIGWRDLPAPGDIVIQVETDVCRNMKRSLGIGLWRLNELFVCLETSARSGRVEKEERHD